MRVLLPLGVPGVALGFFYLLLKGFGFEFETIGPTWSAIIAIVFLVIVGGVTLCALLIWAPGRTKNSLQTEEEQPQPTAPQSPPPILPPDGVSVDIDRLPSSGEFLLGRGVQLGLLTKAWNNETTNIITLVADGGVGKSALVNGWLASMAKNGYRGAQRVYGWSAYSQGSKERVTSADLFIDQALKDFGEQGELSPSIEVRAGRLAELVQAQRTLLILDGIEPLQYPPGPGEGHIKDSGVKTLARKLAAQNAGLCVITTRAVVSDLAQWEGTTCPRIDLKKLQAADGAELLKKLGVDGNQDEREAASKEFGGHALALTLLGTLLCDRHAGDIRRRGEIGPLTHAIKDGGHARRVMDSYETWLGPGPETQILRMLGLFDRPAEAEAVKALRCEPEIEGLTDRIVGLKEGNWKDALTRLRHAGLLAETDRAAPGVIDAHPLVREHFGRKLREENEAAWRAGHDRLFEYFRGPGCAKEFPDTAEEMVPLFAAVQHGCNAGQHQETLHKVYYSRIQRGNELYSTRELEGAFGSELAALSAFFDPPWSEPTAALSDPDKAFLLNQAAFALRAQGRLPEAIEPMKAELDAQMAQENWKNAASQASNLSELSLTLGRTDEAIAFAERSVEYADQSGDAFQRMLRLAALGDALCQAGWLDPAERRFQEAEVMQKDLQAQYPLLYSLQGYQYCDLLLERGRHEDVLDRAAQTLQWGTARKLLLDIGLDHLTLARAWSLAVESGQLQALDQARTSAQAAVDTLRQVGAHEFIARSLLGRAEVYRLSGDLPTAQADLSEAMEIATRDPAGHMKLFETDIHLALARLDLADGNRPSAESHLDTAAALIAETGYHRRDAELARLRAL